MTYRADKGMAGQHIGELVRQGVYPTVLWE
jgi:hypothetical protein